MHTAAACVHMHVHKFSIYSLQGFYYVFTSEFPHRLHVTVQVPVIAFNQPRMNHCEPTLPRSLILSPSLPSQPSSATPYFYHFTLDPCYSSNCGPPVGVRLCGALSLAYVRLHSDSSCQPAPDVRSHDSEGNGYEIRAGDRGPT